MRGATASALADVNGRVEFALGSLIKSVFEGFEAIEDKLNDEPVEDGEEVRGDVDLLDYIKSTVNIVGQELRNALSAHPPDDRGWMKTKHVQMLAVCDAMHAWCDAGNADEILAAEDKDDDVIIEWLRVCVGKMPGGGESIRASRGFLQTLHEIMHGETTGPRRRHAMENFCDMVALGDA